MTFKEWLFQIEGGMIAQGKAQASLAKPGPRDVKHKPHDDIHVCGASGGPAPCQGGGGTAAGAGSVPTPMPTR